MGVRGLTTFLDENRQSLCTYRQFPFQPRSVRTKHNAQAKAPIVIDAWGLIFQLYLTSLPWASGGEYLRFWRLVKRFVEAWRGAGFEPVVVFDGCTPATKHDTVIRRLEQTFHRSQLFYTTSTESRSRPAFCRSDAVLPPFAIHAFIHALRALNVKTHFTPEGEADGVIISLANELGGYVLGADSDFLIMIAGPGSDNVKGYCPFKFVEWIAPNTPGQDAGVGSDQSGWTVASRTKTMGPLRQSNLLPPPDASSPTLVLGIVESLVIRQRFRLPPPYFALLGSLVGNDYTPQQFTRDLFAPNIRGSAQIELVARIIRETHFGPAAREQRQRNAGDQAVQLITTVIERLCRESGQHVGQTQIQVMVDTVIEATLHYVLPPSDSRCCASYPFCGSTEDDCEDDDSRPAAFTARSLYAAAQAKGHIPSMTHAYHAPDRVYLLNVLEDPSESSNMASERMQRLRRLSWQVLEEGLGGLKWPEDEDDSEGVEAETEGEIPPLDGVAPEVGSIGASDGVSSVEESGETTLVEEQIDKDLLAETSLKSFPIVGPELRLIRSVTEYLRHGTSGKLAANTFTLPPLPTDPTTEPAILKPLDFRLKYYLSATSSDTPSTLALPAHLHPLIAAIRLSILDSADGSTAKRDSRWRRSEVEAVLRAGLGMYTGWINETKAFRSRRDSDEDQYPHLETRAAKVVAQLTASMASAHWLAQALLLTSDLNAPSTNDLQAESDTLAPGSAPGPVSGSPDAGSAGGTCTKNETALTHLTPFMFLSGVAIHTLLSGRDPPQSTGWIWSSDLNPTFTSCLGAVLDGLEDKIIPLGRPATHSSRRSTGSANDVTEPARASEGARNRLDVELEGGLEGLEIGDSTADGLADGKEGSVKKRKKKKSGGGSKFSGTKWDLLGDVTL